MPVLNELAAYVATLGLGTVGTSIHIATMPETDPSSTSGTMCAVYEYPGLQSDLGFGDTGVKHSNPSVQVVFRGVPYDYASPRSNAGVAWDGFAGVQATTLSGTYYYLIRPSEVFRMKVDEQHRHYLAFNCQVMKDPS